mmetsp:Transcript_45177/g.150711  ORF Transcript_45177/g.150711 Transcript_45177/m.150711 type:complete len:82 (-) Transcript_45177:965-1210(-)
MARATATAALVLSCVFFMACSAGMMIINKMVLRAVHLPITVVMIQMAFTAGILCVAPCAWLHFGSLQCPLPGGGRPSPRLV